MAHGELIMLGAYTTYTKKIAEFIETVLGDHDHVPLLFDIRQGDTPPFTFVDSFIVLGPIQRGRHSRYLREFVRKHRTAIADYPSLFLSISLAAAGNRRQRDDARIIMNRFLTEMNWEPDQREIVAGDLPYLRYGFLTRWIMRWIVGRAGGDTDASRNYDYTDWGELNRMIGQLTGKVVQASSTQPAHELR